MKAIRLIGDTVISPGGETRVFRPGAVLAEGGRIVRVGPPEDVPENGAETIDASGCAVLPGLTIAHTHLYSVLARGMPAAGAPPDSFRRILERVWWRWDKLLDAPSIAASARAGLLEALHHGVTCVVDHHASPSAVEGSLDVIAGAALEVGARVALAYEVSDRDGEETRDTGLRENLAFASRAGRERSPLLAAMIGAHASFTLGDRTLDLLRDATERSGRPIHMHLDEGPEDGEAARAAGDRSTLARLDRFGLVRPGALFAHGVHLDGEDRELLARRNAFLVHNPLSNGGNAVGRADVPALLAAGATVCLGTDGMSGDLAGEAAAAGSVHRMTTGDRSIPFDLAYRLAWEGNVRLAASLFDPAPGRLEPGAAADMVVIRYDPPTPITPENAAAHWLLGICHAPVEAVFVAGERVIEKGRAVRVDEAAVLAEARDHARTLWKRFTA
ncbi:MAG: amidohydrolase family protein [Candidatus Eisenbacteria bacterium]|nr:amidohydrolase family protein [Candidatus Eisenbacteria bacterium]